MLKNFVLILAAFCLLGAAPVATAEDEQNDIALMPRWSKGQRLDYIMRRSRSRTQGATTVVSRNSTPVRIEVLDANDAGYRIAWTAGETTIDDPAQASNPLAKAMANLTKDATAVIQLDPDTNLRGVENWRELQAMGHRITDACLKTLSNSGLDEATMAKIREQINGVFATKQRVELLFTRNIQLFFVPLGRSYSETEPFEYEDKLANPLGGEPFPTKASFTLEKVDAASDVAVVHWRQEIDPVAGARVLEETLKAMVARMGGSVPSGRALDYVNIKDDAVFTICLSTGWPQQISHTRTTTIAGASQEDSVAFSLSKGD